MTVAAVILAASRESALADVGGQARIRRIADVAWSGGAMPIIVVAPDPEGTVATALAGAPVTLAEPAPPEQGPAGQIHRGLSVAADEVSGLSGALVWPARLAWVGPETVTSLIEAHGMDRDVLLRPAYHGEAGWPILLPGGATDRLAGMDPALMPDEIVARLTADGLATRLVELGDPGTTHDASTSSADLPPYEGPPGPTAAHAHEWGAAVADEPDDAPLAGPAVAPYRDEGTAGR